MDRWHVALTMSGREAVSLARLKEAGFSGMWPRWVEQIVSLGKKREVVRPMASGYLLVRFDGLDSIEWHRVRGLCDARGFIGGDRPAPISELEMSKLLERCETPDGLMTLVPREEKMSRFSPGDVVRMAGVWAGHLGTVAWDDGRGVKLTVMLFGRPTDVWLPYPLADALEETARTSQFHRRSRKSAVHRRAA